MHNLEPLPRRRGLRSVALLLSVAAACAGQFWLVVAPDPTAARLAWATAAFLFGVAYFCAADSRAFPGSDTPLSSSRAEWVWLAVVLLLGVFFVCFRIGEFPPGLNHDAAWEGLYALRILNGEPFTPYTSEAWGRETMTFYFRALSAWWMGPSVLAVQAPAMVAGILTLPFFYGWIRKMFGSRTALAATALLAVSGWHLVFSRTGWRSDFQPLFMAATCYWFFRGVRSARALDFLLAGVALALTLNTYNGSRLFPLVFAAWAVLVVAQSWRWRAFLQRYGVGIGFFALAFLIVIAPLALYAVEHWNVFMGRASALRGASSFGDALRASALLFNYRGNGDDFFVAEPALEFPTAVVFIFGLMWSVLRIRDERAQFLLLGLLINLVPGLVSKPNLNRDIGTMIFVYALAGVGLSFVARQAGVLLPRIGRIAANGIVVAVVIAATVAGYQQYLSHERRPIWGYYPETTVLGRYMHDLVPQFDIWVGGANFPRDSLTYLSYQGEGDPMRRNYTWLDDVRVLARNPPVARGGKGLAFLLANEGEARGVFSALQRRYAGSEVVELRYPPDTGRVFAKALLVREPGAERADVPVEAPALASVVPVDRLAEPRGITVARDGTVAVADFGHHRIVLFDRDLHGIRAWGEEGGDAGQFRQPSDVEFGKDGRVYVADTWNGRVQMFSRDGSFLGQSTEVLYGPRALAVAPDGRVVVADTGNSRIVIFDAELKLVGTFGAKGTAAGEFSEPIGVAVDNSSRIWVADNGNSRLQVFSATGDAEMQLPVPGWSSEVFSEPRLEFGPEGLIWATEPRLRKLRAYDSAGQVAREIDDSSVEARFDMPMGIASGAEGLLISGLNGSIGWVRVGDGG